MEDYPPTTIIGEDQFYSKFGKNPVGDDRKINLRQYVPDYRKDERFYDLVGSLETVLNEIFEGTSEFDPAVTKISILEKINRLLDLQDPEKIPINLLHRLAENLGYSMTMNIWNASDITSLPIEIRKYLRFFVGSLIEINRMKCTKDSVRGLMHSVGVLTNIYYMWTSDYDSNSDFRWKSSNENDLYEDVSGVNVEKVHVLDPAFYLTPHFELDLDLTSFDLSVLGSDIMVGLLRRVAQSIDNVKPVQTVVDDLSLSIPVQTGHSFKGAFVEGWGDSLNSWGGNQQDPPPLHTVFGNLGLSLNGLDEYVVHDSSIPQPTNIDAESEDLSYSIFVAVKDIGTVGGFGNFSTKSLLALEVTTSGFQVRFRNDDGSIDETIAHSTPILFECHVIGFRWNSTTGVLSLFKDGVAVASSSPITSGIMILTSLQTGRRVSNGGMDSYFGGIVSTLAVLIGGVWSDSDFSAIANGLVPVNPLSLGLSYDPTDSFQYGGDPNDDSTSSSGKIINDINVLKYGVPWNTAANQFEFWCPSLSPPKSLFFDGQKTYIDATSAMQSILPSWANSNFEIAFRFKTTFKGDSQVILSFTTSVAIEFMISVNSVGMLEVYTTDGTYGNWMRDQSQYFDDGQWHHGIVEWDSSKAVGDELSLFIDGDYSNSIQNMDVGYVRPSNAITQCLLGSTVTSIDFPFYGFMSDIRINNSLWSDIEKLQIWNNGNPLDVGEQPIPSHHWPLGDGVGDDPSVKFVDVVGGALYDIIPYGFNIEYMTGVESPKFPRLPWSTKSFMFNSSTDGIIASNIFASFGTTDMGNTIFGIAISFNDPNKFLGDSEYLFSMTNGAGIGELGLTVDNNGKIQARIITDDGESSSIWSTFKDWRTGAWHQVVFLWDGTQAPLSEMTLAVDGIVQGTQVGSGGWAGGSCVVDTIIIGEKNIVTESKSGSISDFAINIANVSTPWTVSDIPEIYNLGLPTDLGAISTPATHQYRFGDDINDTPSYFIDTIGNSDINGLNFTSDDIKDDAPWAIPRHLDSKSIQFEGSANSSYGNLSNLFSGEFSSFDWLNNDWTIAMRMEVFEFPAGSDYCFSLGKTGDANFRISISHNSADSKIQCLMRDSSGVYRVVSSASAINDHRWLNVSMSWDSYNKALTMYMDGVYEGIDSVGTGVMSGTMIADFGYVMGIYIPVSAVYGYTKGRVCDLSIWDAKFSSSEHLEWQNSERTIDCNKHSRSGALKTWFRFGDGVGDTVSTILDQSPFNHVLHLVNVDSDAIKNDSVDGVSYIGTYGNGQDSYFEYPIAPSNLGYFPVHGSSLSDMTLMHFGFGCRFRIHHTASVVEALVQFSNYASGFGTVQLNIESSGYLSIQIKSNDGTQVALFIDNLNVRDSYTHTAYMIWDGTANTIYLYLDGNLRGSYSTSFTVPVTCDACMIMARPFPTNSVGKFIKGEVDSVVFLSGKVSHIDMKLLNHGAGSPNIYEIPLSTKGLHVRSWIRMGDGVGDDVVAQYKDQIGNHDFISNGNPKLIQYRTPVLITAPTPPTIAFENLRSLSFDGTKSFSWHNDIDFAFTDVDGFAIAFWIKKTGSTANGGILQKVEPIGGTTDIELLDNSGTLEFRTRVGGVQRLISGVHALSGWNSVVITHDETQRNIFVNGVSIAEEIITYSGLNNERERDFIFGKNPIGNGLIGVACQFSVFGKRFTTADAVEFHNSGVPIDPRTHTKSSDLKMYVPVRDTTDEDPEFPYAIKDIVGRNHIVGQGLLIADKGIDHP